MKGFAIEISAIHRAGYCQMKSTTDTRFSKLLAKIKICPLSNTNSARINLVYLISQTKYPHFPSSATLKPSYTRVDGPS